MYNVSSAFKNAIRQPIKEVDAYLELADSSTITPANDLVSVKIEAENGIGKLVMKKVDIKLLGYHSSLINTLVTPHAGVKVSGSFEYINYGQFLITEVEDSKDTGMCTCKGYDRMIYTNVPYEAVNVTYPCTVHDFAAAVCQACGLQLASSSWPNSDVLLQSDRYVGIEGMQYRDALNDIASASGTIVMLSNDQVCFKTVTDTGEILTYDDLKTFKLQPKYGPVNGVVLARVPQEDNIALQDTESVEEYGLTEYRVENNQLVDDQRASFIEGLATQMYGVEYYPFEAKTIGLAYLEIGDLLTVQAEDGNYSVYISSMSLTVDGGISETLKSSAAEKTSTNYSRAGGITKRINRTEIIVDKQAGIIESAVEATEQLQSDLSDAAADLQRQITAQGTLIQQNSDEITLRAYQESVDDALSGEKGVYNRLKRLETSVSIDTDGLKVKQNDDGSYVLITDAGMEIYVNKIRQAYATTEGFNAAAFLAGNWHIQPGNNGNSLNFFKKGV